MYPMSSQTYETLPPGRPPTYTEDDIKRVMAEVAKANGSKLNIHRIARDTDLTRGKVKRILKANPRPPEGETGANQTIGGQDTPARQGADPEKGGNA